MGTDRETGRSRGFAFVEFATADEAAAAIKQFDGQEIDGRKVRVNIADERPRSPGGGPPRSPRGPSSGDGGMAAAFHAPLSTDFRPDEFGGGRSFKNKGSRRGLRRRKRSLSF